MISKRGNIRRHWEHRETPIREDFPTIDREDSMDGRMNTRIFAIVI